jgi:hypothetical protein
MISEKKIRNVQKLFLTFIAMLIFSSLMMSAVADFPQPTAPDTMTNVSTESPAATGGYAQNTSGGTITTLNIDATTQNPHWKAYVGNISGKLALQDANNNSVYDWNISSMEGEIYATRKSAVVAWDSIECANLTHIQTEETDLNMTTSDVDSIVSTFNQKSHSAFYAGLSSVGADSCNSTNLYVNNESSSDFAELLLYDGADVVYAALVEDSITGFDGTEYDFQMIVPESGLEGSQTPETYYFYVELI